MSSQKRYNTFGRFLRERFGRRTFKVSLWGDFTCPNRDGTRGKGGCIFCQPETLKPVSLGEDESIEDQLERGIAYLKRRYKAEGFIAYFQSYSNTYAPLERLKSLYNKAISHPDVVALAVSTRADTVDDNVLDLLYEISRKKFLWIEYGLQSANEKTLKFLNRGHTIEEFLSTYYRTVEIGINVCIHVILGLPGEEREDIIETARFLSALKIWGIKIHHLQVYRGTGLEDLYRKGRLKLLTLEDYVSLVVDFMEYLPESTIIHRLVGDAPRDFLIAPEWGNKLKVINAINRYMEEKDTYQGIKA